jgi:glycosyltransferase involved in cell wall biosynthesis
MRLGTPPLYIHFAHRPTTVGRFASLLLGTPFAVAAHAVDVWKSPADELRVRLRDARVVLSCYEEAREYLATLTLGRTPVELVRHGVDIPPNPARAEVLPPVMLAVGRLIEKKGFDTLLRAAALLRQRGLEFRLHIAGDGPLWPNLARLAGELGLVDHARFIGPLTHDELEPHFASAAMFVLPCQIGSDGNRDGLPNTILEAMARRLPVVSTTLPSVLEAIEDGREGLVVPPRDPEALAGALGTLLEDPGLRARLGEAGRERVKREFDRAVLSALPYEVLLKAGMIGPRGS